MPGWGHLITHAEGTPMSENENTLQAWNLAFGAEGGVRRIPDHGEILPRPGYAPSGWTGSDGPAIAWKHWPRHTVTGLPMAHVLTLFLPEPYRRRGADLVGISLFSAGGEGGEDNYQERAAASFRDDVAAAEDHPHLQRREDIIGGEFAFLWLTQAELAGGPTPPAPDTRGPNPDTGEYVNGANAWDDVVPRSDVWLVPRADPNAGKVPQEHGDEGGYVQPWSDGAEEWSRPLNGCSHLGGTSFHVQAMPDGLTPWYLELEEIPPMNLGDSGNLQLDLESDTFDWACG